MGIINGYDDIKMIVSAPGDKELRSILSGRVFELVKTEPGVYIDRRKMACPFVSDHLLEVDEGDKSQLKTYLRFYPPEYREINRKQLKECKGIVISHPSVDELTETISGKRLIFTAHYAEDKFCVEQTLNKMLQKNVFDLRNEKEHYLYDDYFDVKVFLRKVSGDTNDGACMNPADIRDLDVSEKLLSKLNNVIKRFYNDALTFYYTSVSEKLQAQYFLTKFYCNREWKIDQVCILNFRIAAFTLPGGITENAASVYDDDKTARSVKDGSKYVIDSIHVGSDICFTVSEFDYLIHRLMLNISLA